MTVKNESFLALEDSLRSRLWRAVRKRLLPLVSRISKAAADGDFGLAQDLASQIDMVPAVESERKFIDLSGTASMMYGARDFAQPKNTFVAKDGPGPELDNATQSLINMFRNSGNEQLRTLAGRLIEEERVAQQEESTQKVQKQATAGFVKQFAKKVGDTASAFTGLGSSLHTSRLAAWGFTTEAELRGWSFYEVSEVLDGRTCEVCKVMDGKVFPVSNAKVKLQGWLAEQDPDILKSIAKFPRQDRASVSALRQMSEGDLIGRGWDTPPYHPWCRGVLRRTDKVAETAVVPSVDPLAPAIAPKPNAPQSVKEALVAEGTFNFQLSEDKIRQVQQLASAKKAGRKMYMLDVDAVEEQWGKSGSAYIYSGGDAATDTYRNAYTKARKQIDEEAIVFAPEVELGKNEEVFGAIKFKTPASAGRYAAMRDAGLTEVPVTMTGKTADAYFNRGILARPGAQPNFTAPVAAPVASTATPAAEPAQVKEFLVFNNTMHGEEWGKENFKKWADGLPMQERDAVWTYTGSDYSAINGALRAGDLDNPMNAFYKQTSDNLFKALNKANVPEDVQVYRGVANTKAVFGKSGDELQELIGKTFKDEAFMSTSVSEGVAGNFKRGEGAFIKIDVPAGTKGAYVSPISKYQNENELLLNRGTTFRIKSVAQERYFPPASLDSEVRTVINMEVIEQAKKMYTQDKEPIQKQKMPPDPIILQGGKGTNDAGQPNIPAKRWWDKFAWNGEGQLIEVTDDADT